MGEQVEPVVGVTRMSTPPSAVHGIWCHHAAESTFSRTVPLEDAFGSEEPWFVPYLDMPLLASTVYLERSVVAGPALPSVELPSDQPWATDGVQLEWLLGTFGVTEASLDRPEVLDVSSRYQHVRLAALTRNGNIVASAGTGSSLPIPSWQYGCWRSAQVLL